MLSNLTGWHFLIILVVILLLFGAPKLPGLARSLGQSMNIFKNEIKNDSVDQPADTTGAPASTESADGTTRPVGPGDQTKS
jgi:sec-independent protein translocase protein TatA